VRLCFRADYAASVPVFTTPEDAARGDIPEQYVRVVGVVVRGDQAVVAQLTNDGPPFEVETAYCEREGEGWLPSASGNSTAGFLPFDAERGTLVVWDAAPAGATAARFEYAGQEQIVQVENGAALAVFNDVPGYFGYRGPPWPLRAWILENGQEIPV
jgi:hypothetical protein